FTTLLAREFELPDTLRLWDTLLADPKRFGQLFYSCVAMVYCLRKKLLACDFSRTLMTLQEYGEQMVDVERIIDTAAKIRVWDTREGSGVTLVKGVPTHPDDDAIVAALGEAGVVPGTGGSGGTGTRRSSAASTSSASSLSLLGAATGRMFGLARGLAQTGARRLSAALSAPVPAAAVLAQPAEPAPAAAPAQAAPSPARASRSSRPALGPGTMVVTPIDEGAGDDDEEGTGESAEDALCATPSEDAGGAHNPFATPPPSPSTGGTVACKSLHLFFVFVLDHVSALRLAQRRNGDAERGHQRCGAREPTSTRKTAAHSQTEEGCAPVESQAAGPGPLLRRRRGGGARGVVAPAALGRHWLRRTLRQRLERFNQRGSRHNANAAALVSRQPGNVAPVPRRDDHGGDPGCLGGGQLLPDASHG
ncbi:TBC1D13, partial [Symbiodinium microadriaticum]